MGLFCDNIISGSHFVLAKQLQLRWRKNRKAASLWYYLQFPWENGKHGRGEKSGGLKHFRYLYLFSFLTARENNLLLSLLRNGSSLMYPFLFWRFYKMLFVSVVLFWRNYNNCKGVQSLEICHFEPWNLFSHQFWFKNPRFQPPTWR